MPETIAQGPQRAADEYVDERTFLPEVQAGVSFPQYDLVEKMFKNDLFSDIAKAFYLCSGDPQFVKDLIKFQELLDKGDPSINGWADWRSPPLYRESLRVVDHLIKKYLILTPPEVVNIYYFLMSFLVATQKNGAIYDYFRGSGTGDFELLYTQEGAANAPWVEGSKDYTDFGQYMTHRGQLLISHLVDEDTAKSLYNDKEGVENPVEFLTKQISQFMDRNAFGDFDSPQAFQDTFNNRDNGINALLLHYYVDFCTAVETQSKTMSLEQFATAVQSVTRGTGFYLDPRFAATKSVLISLSYAIVSLPTVQEDFFSAQALQTFDDHQKYELGLLFAMAGASYGKLVGQAIENFQNRETK